MAQFQFSTQGINAGVGGAGYGLWVDGMHPVVIVKTDLKRVKDTNSNNGYVELILKDTGGPNAGQETAWRLNKWNDNEVTERIANEQLAAVCIVCGLPNGIQQDTDELLNRPFILESKVTEKNGQKNQNFTGIFYSNGTPLASNAQPQQQQPAPAGFAPNANVQPMQQAPAQQFQQPAQQFQQPQQQQPAPQFQQPQQQQFQQPPQTQQQQFAPNAGQAPQFAAPQQQQPAPQFQQPQGGAPQFQAPQGQAPQFQAPQGGQPQFQPGGQAPAQAPWQQQR